MDTNKLVVVSCLDEGVVSYFYEDVVSFLDKYNKDGFDVDIRNSLDECLNHFSSRTPR